MTLPEQIEYINRIKEKVLEYESYEFVTINNLNYAIFELSTKMPIISLTQQTSYERREDMFLIKAGSPYEANFCVTCMLEDFLCTHFSDMINPTLEEKVMWKLQFGFDWFF